MSLKNAQIDIQTPPIIKRLRIFWMYIGKFLTISIYTQITFTANDKIVPINNPLNDSTCIKQEWKHPFKQSYAPRGI